jgi:mono/diheme cytochrome c family protein
VAQLSRNGEALLRIVKTAKLDISTSEQSSLYLEPFILPGNKASAPRRGRWRRVRTELSGTPMGIRTPVRGLRIRCPRPLDDGSGRGADSAPIDLPVNRRAVVSWGLTGDFYWASIVCMRIALLVVALATLSAAEQSDPQAAAKAYGVLKENCFKCHGPDKRKGDLRLDTAAGVAKGGEHGTVLVPGQPEKSVMIKAVAWTDEDSRMPPKKKLSDEQIAALTAWVKAGAPWPAEQKQRP